MKLFLVIIIFLFVSISGFGQIMQASIGSGSSPNRFYIYIKPTSAINGTISTLQFDVAIDASILPAPVLSIVGVPYLSLSWNIDASYIEDGYRHYQITTASSPSVVIAAEAETQVMELEFSDGPLIANNVSLITLPGGGANTGNALFFCSGVANSAEGQLYYARTGTTVINNLSYTGPLASSATIAGILLPLKWGMFNVTKDKDDALLNWTAENQSAENDYFEIERSINGTDFENIGRVDVNLNSTNAATYRYSDTKLSSNRNNGIFYYRIKLINKNGEFAYTEVKSVKLDDKQIEVTIYPNPVKDICMINVDLPAHAEIHRSLTDVSGKLISTLITRGIKGRNMYRLDMAKLASGTYFLKISSGNASKVIPVIKK